MCKNTVSANLYVNSIFISRFINLRYQQNIHYKYRNETDIRPPKWKQVRVESDYEIWDSKGQRY